jgi:hypothetical protein
MHTNGDSLNGHPVGRGPAKQSSAGDRSATHRSHQLRAKLLESISEGTIETVAGTLAEMARNGNLAAIKLLLEYAAGRPAQARELKGPRREPDGPDWERLRSLILGALAPHPQAQLDLAAALDAFARDEPGREARQGP